MLAKEDCICTLKNKEDLFESICKSNQQVMIDERSGLLQNKNIIRKDFGIFYDNFLKALQGTDKVRIEALGESVYNQKLRNILKKNRKEIEQKCRRISQGNEK